MEEQIKAKLEELREGLQADGGDMELVKIDGKVVYLRLVTSGYLQREDEFFQYFIEGGRTVREFCQQEVEPAPKGGGHILILALASPAG